MKRAFGAQLSGRPFTIATVNGWVERGKIADAYGGHRILQVARYAALDNLRVFTIEGLYREDIEAVMGSLSEFKETLNKHRAKDTGKKGKRRTALYWQTLGARGKVGLKTAIPDNYRELGIKDSQFKK